METVQVRLICTCKTRPMQRKTHACTRARMHVIPCTASTLPSYIESYAASRSLLIHQIVYVYYECALRDQGSLMVPTSKINVMDEDEPRNAQMLS
jgi:hypothetical protein